MTRQGQGRYVRRALAISGTAMLALGGIAATGTAAFADGGDEDPPTTSEIANIDMQQPRTLTVHKFPEVGNEDPFSPTGSDAPGGGMVGVDFTIQKVLGLDLGDPDSWTIAQNLEFVPADPEAPADAYATDGVNNYALGAGTTQATMAPDGTTTFIGLDFAVYVVTEGADHGDNEITNKAAPFFVTLPLPHSGDWIYAVHVFPKNSVSMVDKSVTSPNAPGLGETLTWPITVQIPTMSADTDFTRFVVEDQLDSRLQYVSYTMKVGATDVAGAIVEEPSTTNPGGTFRATLVGTGVDLNTFLKSHAGETLEIVLTTRVVSLEPSGEGDSGVIPNFANVKINDYDTDTTTVHTFWGDLWIHKTDNFQKALEDAVFEIYECAVVEPGAPAATTGSAINVLVGDDPADPEDWATQFSSDDTGKVYINGLWVSNGASTDTHDYCLKEVSAPAGYDLMTPNPMMVTVSVGSSSSADITVANPQKPPVRLPLTGSVGTGLFMAGGLALVLIAGGAALVSARKREREARQQ